MRRQVTYNPQRDYYAILGIDAQSSPEMIRRAYRKAVRDAHPDRNPDRVEWATERLMLLNEAYDVLGNPDLRRRYDRMRWPYVPYTPPDRSASPHDAWADPSVRSRSPFEGVSRWNVPPAGPRWQQVVDDPTGSAYAGMRAPEPEWRLFAEWLKDHRLGALEPAWLALVGLWRSPYRRILVTLVLALWMNLSFLTYVVLSPGSAARTWSDLREWAGISEPVPALPATPSLGATPALLYVVCMDPAIQITRPLNSDVIGDRLTVFGTVQPPDLGTYTLLMGYLGPVFSRTAQPERWMILRTSTGDGADDLPVTDSPLTTGPVDMTDQPLGYWVLRLAVTARDGSPLRPCDVIFQHW